MGVYDLVGCTENFDLVKHNYTKVNLWELKDNTVNNMIGVYNQTTV